MASSSQVTRLLSDISGGRSAAAEELLPLVYDELRHIARGFLERERTGHTLQPTALVHEVYLKLVDQSQADIHSQTHFKAVAAQAMRRILIDHARAGNREKRGGDWRKVTLYDAFRLSKDPALDAIDVNDALEKMRSLDPRQARLVEMRLFGGLSNEEAARQLGVSTRTAERDWKMGQAWLRRELGKGTRTHE